MRECYIEALLSMNVHGKHQPRDPPDGEHAVPQMGEARCGVLGIVKVGGLALDARVPPQPGERNSRQAPAFYLVNAMSLAPQFGSRCGDPRLDREEWKWRGPST
jgi:hypothetical protein